MIYLLEVYLCVANLKTPGKNWEMIASVKPASRFLPELVKARWFSSIFDVME